MEPPREEPNARLEVPAIEAAPHSSSSARTGRVISKERLRIVHARGGAFFHNHLASVAQGTPYAQLSRSRRSAEENVHHVADVLFVRHRFDCLGWKRHQRFVMRS